MFVAVGLFIFVVGYCLYSWKKNSTMTIMVIFISLLYLMYLLALYLNILSDNFLVIMPLSTMLIKKQLVSTAWVYERPIPQTILRNIEILSDLYGVPVRVYCGTSQCIQAVSDLQNRYITAEFLVIPHIVEGLPLENWAARHAFNKVLVRKEFETHLQEAVKLGIVWNHGGFYIDPTIQITSSVGEYVTKCNINHSAFISREVVNDVTTFLGFLCFLPKHTFIYWLAEVFVDGYPVIGSDYSVIKFDFQELIQDFVINTSYPIITDVNLKRISLNRTASEIRHFGTLFYNKRVSYVKANNLGDEIQSLSGLQYLPFVDELVERDNLLASERNYNITVFFNAWWGSDNCDWPPPRNIHPIMLSVHIDKNMKAKLANHTDYLKSFPQIGCRDVATLNFLKENGVTNAFFSGCLTLLIRNPIISGNRTDNIYFVDIGTKYYKFFPIRLRNQGINIHHSRSSGSFRDGISRVTSAYQLLEMYGRAKLIITQRIHAALPCVAMGTPVIFINSAGLPGDVNRNNLSSSRVSGLSKLFHTVDLYTMSDYEIKLWFKFFPWDNPPPNPNVNLLMQLRATEWNVIRKNKVFYDSAKKFGMIPMSLPPQISKKLLFHLIFTTSSSPALPMLSSKKVVSRLNRRQWRSIESIFYHHPTADVIMHSNTLPDETFDVLTESAYSIKIKRYDLEELLEDSPACKLVGMAMNGKNWHSYQTDLLRYLVLYKWGGVYMDTDVIIVRPLDSLKMNTLGWEDMQKRRLSSSFMMFEKGSSYLKSCLEEFSEHYVADTWRYDESDLLSIVKSRWKHGSDAIHVVNYKYFYPIHFSDLKKHCFENTYGPIFELNKQTIDTRSYCVQLSSKVTSQERMGEVKLKIGTLCSHLLNSFCILCNIS